MSVGGHQLAKNERVKRGLAAEGFWDRPVLMNLVADMLLLGAVALLVWAALAGVQRLPFYPLREVVVVSPVDHVGRAQIEHVARTAISGNLLSVNLDAARGAFEKLPWVRRVELRRVWPDALEIAIEEHVALARWVRPDPAGSPEGRLVNSHGEVFNAVAAAKNLPSLNGPEGTAAVMLERLREFDNRLAAIARQPVALTLTARAAWQVRLDDGVVIDLGRDQPRLPLSARLDRFASHYAAARNRSGLPVAAVDMRYPNGFVLHPGSPDIKSKES